MIIEDIVLSALDTEFPEDSYNEHQSLNEHMEQEVNHFNFHDNQLHDDNKEQQPQRISSLCQEVIFENLDQVNHQYKVTYTVKELNNNEQYLLPSNSKDEEKKENENKMESPLRIKRNIKKDRWENRKFKIPKSKSFDEEICKSYSTGSSQHSSKSVNSKKGMSQVIGLFQNLQINPKGFENEQYHKENQFEDDFDKQLKL